MNQRVRAFAGVTVFGGATIDRIARSSEPAVIGASNPGTVRRAPGGVAFNVATILARLGVETRLVSRVGADPDGEHLIATARAAGVDTAMIGVSREAATAGYHATFDSTGDLIVGIADMAICLEVDPAVVAPAVLAGASSDFWVVDANLPSDTLAFLVEEAAVAGCPVVALTVSPAKAVRFAPLLGRLSHVFTNRLEAAALIGSEPHDKTLTTAHAATELTRLGAPKAIVTDGVNPLAAASGAEVRSFTPFRTDVKAVNGAGDSFAAGTIAGLGEGRTLNEAIRFGLAAAALTVESGGIAAAPFAPGALGERLGGAKRMAS